ncbi:tyrosine-type recombinase/integrase [Kocuria rhizophila]|nr:tyrosine-type recombinase/integrase [Kocuria rhizophila]
MDTPQAWSTALTGFSTWMRAASRSESTIALRVYWIRRLAQSTAADSPATITEEQITDWLAQGCWKPATRKSALASVRRFFTWMALYHHRASNPTACLLNVPAPCYRARPTPDAVLRRALEAAPDSESALMLMLPAYAGLRRQEIACLHTSHVETRWLTINGKGQRVRKVPIHPELEPLLELRSTGYFFPSPRAPHRSPDYIGRRIARLLGSGYTAHQLRHWFATRAYDATRDIRAVQELLGHANVVTTQTYVGLTDQVLAHAVKALPVIDLPSGPAGARTDTSPINTGSETRPWQCKPTTT